MFGKKIQFQLNNFNKNKILNQLILFIHYVYKDKINVNKDDKLYNEYNSALYRLYLGFIYYHGLNPDSNFLSWIILINSGNINGLNQIIDVTEYFDKYYNLHEFNDIIIEDLNTCDYKSNEMFRNIIIDALKDGNVFKCDLKLLKEICDTNNIDVYTKAKILNKKHFGRGINYAESVPARNVHHADTNKIIKLTLNQMNDLFTYWYMKADKNAWFMLKDVTQLPNCEGNYFQLIYTSVICNIMFIF